MEGIPKIQAIVRGFLARKKLPKLEREANIDLIPILYERITQLETMMEFLIQENDGLKKRMDDLYRNKHTKSAQKN